MMLIELVEPIYDIEPIKLNTNTKLPFGTGCTAIGWGTLESGG